MIADLPYSYNKISEKNSVMALVRMRIAIICKESMLVSFLQRFNSNSNNISLMPIREGMCLLTYILSFREKTYSFIY